MRIAFLQMELNAFGGAERVLTEFLNQLSTRNEVSLFVATSSPEIEKMFSSRTHVGQHKHSHEKSHLDDYVFSRRLFPSREMLSTKFSCSTRLYAISVAPPSVMPSHLGDLQVSDSPAYCGLIHHETAGIEPPSAQILSKTCSALIGHACS